MTISFHNPGILHPASLTTFGLSVKDTTNPIGKFGTGLKMSIATILRLGGNIKIYTMDEDKNKTTYNFTTSDDTIRGKLFSFVHMEVRKHSYEHLDDSYSLGFTTELGKHWLPWMAYRELRSNMMDEGGVMGETYPAPYTDIVVDCPEVEETHARRAKFFLETVPLWKNDQMEIHPGREDPAIFYRGIRVAMPSLPCLYTYNILTEENLTEDRTLDLWSCSWRIVSAIRLLDNPTIAEKILLANSDHFESTLKFDYVETLSEAMRNAIRLNRYNQNLNTSAKRRAKVRYESDFLPKALPMSDELRKRVAEARYVLQQFNLPEPWEEIVLGDMTEDDDDTMLSGTTLFIKESEITGDDFLLRLIDIFLRETAYIPFKHEDMIVRLMARLRPELPGLRPYLPAEPPPSETEATAGISGPTDFVDEIPWENNF